MEKKSYDQSLLMMGVLSVKGFPSSLKEKLEKEFGPIALISEEIDFSFTDYYVPEMGVGIKRFFIAFETLISPDKLAEVKTFTNSLELEWADENGRKINLDPGLISESNLILATTKNRAHRIPIGMSLYGEVTLIYHKKGWQSFAWSYADYKSEVIQKTLNEFRAFYLQRPKRT